MGIHLVHIFCYSTALIGCHVVTSELSLAKSILTQSYNILLIFVLLGLLTNLLFNY